MLAIWKGNKIAKDCIFNNIYIVRKWLYEIGWSDLLLFDNRLLISDSGLITFSIFYEEIKPKSLMVICIMWKINAIVNEIYQTFDLIFHKKIN